MRGISLFLSLFAGNFPSRRARIGLRRQPYHCSQLFARVRARATLPLEAWKTDGICGGIFGINLHVIGPGDTVLKLTDTRIRSARPKAQAFKLSDGGGMYLLVTPEGGRYWRMDYRFLGKRRTVALGVYPTVTLSNARVRREEARELLAQNIDPNEAKKSTKRASKLAAKNTFEAVAREFFAKRRNKLSLRV